MCKRIDDPDLSLEDLMKVWPETIPVFIRNKMLCVGCLVSPHHTVIDACKEYGLDETAFNAELQNAITALPRRAKPTGVDREQ